MVFCEHYVPIRRELEFNRWIALAGFPWQINWGERKSPVIVQPNTAVICLNSNNFNPIGALLLHCPAWNWYIHVVNSGLVPGDNKFSWNVNDCLHIKAFNSIKIRNRNFCFHTFLPLDEYHMTHEVLYQRFCQGNLCCNCYCNSWWLLQHNLQLLYCWWQVQIDEMKLINTHCFL